MPIRRSPNGARHVRSQPGRNRPERVVAINRNAWSQSVGTGGRNHPVRAPVGSGCRIHKGEQRHEEIYHLARRRADGNR